MKAANTKGLGAGVTDSPGQVLAAAREAQGMSYEAIHEKTLIPVWKLKALESDQFKQLGGRPFAVGYLRQVAKLLELDAEPLVENFNKICQPEIKYELESERAASSQAARQRSQKPLLGSLWSPWTLLILVVLWVVSVWLFREDQAEGELGSGTALQEPQPAEEFLDESDLLPASEQNLPLSSHPSESSDSAQESTVELMAPSDSSLPNSQSAVDEGDQASASVAEAEVQSSTDTQALEPEEGGQDNIVMTFSEQCWVEVRDVHEELLVAKLYDKGDNLQLFGEGPFSVLLGNAVAAEVKMNGEQVPVVLRGSQKTLRMLVGARSSD